MSESNLIVECCPYCSSENAIMWDIETSGYKAFCSYCGNRLMLCSMCDSRCDYDTDTDSCKYNNN